MEVTSKAFVGQALQAKGITFTSGASYTRSVSSIALMPSESLLNSDAFLTGNPKVRRNLSPTIALSLKML